jgi:hypothetical protein
MIRKCQRDLLRLLRVRNTSEKVRNYRHHHRLQVLRQEQIQIPSQERNQVWKKMKSLESFQEIQEMKPQEENLRKQIRKIYTSLTIIIIKYV